MRIVIDVQGIQTDASKNRGVGRYITEILKEFFKLAKDHEIILVFNVSLFFDVLIDEKFIFHRNNKGWQRIDNNIDLSGKNGDSERRKLEEKNKEQFMLDLNPDIIWIPNLQEGLADNAVTSVKQVSSNAVWVSTLYDVIPLIYKDSYLSNLKVGDWYKEKITHAENSDYIITISEYSKTKIKELTKCKEENIFIVPPAINNNIFNNQNLPKKNTKDYILYVSGYNPHKNVEALIEAYGNLNKELKNKYDLLLIGKSLHHHLYKFVEEKSIQNVIFKEDVPDNELIEIYKSSSLFVFPSYSEGFGIPPLEAMVCGVPTITSNAASLPEIVGWKDAMFDPNNKEDLTKLIEKSLTNETFKSQLIENGLKRCELFSWQKSAKALLNIFEKIKK
jgi:glycosyltransferase involved in cell wall biosynthesis